MRPTQKSLLLLDLGSTNGTWYNDRRLSPGDPQPLKDKDIIGFGALRLSVTVVSHPPSAIL